MRKNQRAHLRRQQLRRTFRAQRKALQIHITLTQQAVGSNQALLALV
jgi:hypothetical protein